MIVMNFIKLGRNNYGGIIMKKDIGIMFIICAPMLFGAFFGIIIYADSIITPMDVYQGKTTLEYKVVDGVKVDSTVVWKNNK